MFYRHNKTFWYQVCNFKHFLKAENSEDSLASSRVEFSIGLSCNPVWDWVTIGTSQGPFFHHKGAFNKNALLFLEIWLLLYSWNVLSQGIGAHILFPSWSSFWVLKNKFLWFFHRNTQLSLYVWSQKIVTKGALYFQFLGIPTTRNCPRATDVPTLHQWHVIGENISSNIKLFADDCLLFRKINKNRGYPGSAGRSQQAGQLDWEVADALQCKKVLHHEDTP